MPDQMNRLSSAALSPGSSHTASLIDILDRVLDKGLVVAGDIKISLAEVELLTIRIRLIVCSLDKAQEIGLDWWRYDQHFSPRGRVDTALRLENEELKQQVEQLERRVAALAVTRNGKKSRTKRGTR